MEDALGVGRGISHRCSILEVLSKMMAVGMAGRGGAVGGSVDMSLLLKASIHI